MCFFSLTGARVQSQSEQIWMYNRYEIVMEYAKRPRLPPPFVVISYISKFQYDHKNRFRSSENQIKNSQNQSLRNNSLVSSDTLFVLF